ncbi:MAG TPA: O-antigen ligase family protein, partial [Gemmatimonadaceae bacterium]
MTAPTQLVSVGLGAGPAGALGRLRVRPVAILQFVVFLFVIGNLGRIPFLDLGSRTAPILVNDILMGVAFLTGALTVIRDRSLRLTDVAVAGLVFAAIGGLSAVAGIERFGFSAMELIGSLAYLARWGLYFSLYVVVINCVRARDVEGLWDAFEWAMVIIVVFGIVQSIFLPNFAFMVYSDSSQANEWDAQRNRLVSTLMDPNLAAALTAVTLLVQLSRMASGAREPLWKPALMFAGLVMTLSRGGLLTLAVGCAVLLPILGLRKQIVRLMAVLGALLLVFSPKLIGFAAQYTRFTVSDESALTRVVIWKRSLATFLDYPIFGIGFNTYGFVQERRGFARVAKASYSAEGGLLFVVVMTGIVGLLVYI